MNQDYLLDPTPGLARRLVAISRLCNIDLDPKIAMMATEDLLAADAFDAGYPDTPMRRSMMQWMLDCGLRCGILGESGTEITRDAVLKGLAAAGVEKVTIASQSFRKEWHRALHKMPFRAGSIVVCIEDAFDAETQAGRRDGVLIIDWPADIIDESSAAGAMAAALCREFPRTIIYYDVGAAPRQMRLSWSSWSPHLGHAASPSSSAWWNMAIMLFPNMPGRVFDLSSKLVAQDVMHRSAWLSSKFDLLSILYNVFLPECLADYGATNS